MIRRLTDATERAQALEWLAQRLDTTPRDLVWSYAYELLCVYRDGEIAGVMLFIHWRGRSVEVHLTGVDGWFSRSVIRSMCRFAFDVLGVTRLEAIIGAENVHARVSAERVGFELEGMQRETEDGGGDTALYAMLKRKCRWIENGTVQQEQGSEVRRSGSGRSADEGQPAGVWS